MNNATKLLNKNFILFVMGWEFSMIGDAMLRFALPLYIFLQTGNAILLGSMLTISSLPVILLTPLGGVMADRYSKRKLMVTINLMIAGMGVFYAVTSDGFDLVFMTTALTLVLFTLTAVSTPSAEASFPLLVPEGELVKANSVTFLLTIFSSVGAPIVAGNLLERHGLTPILWTSIGMFILASLVKSMVKIPYEVPEKKARLSKVIASDLKKGIRFAVKEKPQIGKVMLMTSLASVTIAPIMSVGLSVLVTNYFARGEATLGIAQGLVVFGGTFGIVLVGILGKRATVALMRPLILILGLSLIPAGIALVQLGSQNTAFVMTLATFFMTLALMTLLAVVSWAYLGEATPEALLGKVMALNATVLAIGVAIGNSLYGFLFDHFIESPGAALFVLAGLTLVIGVGSKIERS